MTPHNDTIGPEPASPSTEPHYGRRIEADRSWTVYHVFTGIPALDGAGAMTGLSQGDATEGMLSLNRRSALAGVERVRQLALAHARAAKALSTTALQRQDDDDADPLRL